MFTQLHTFTDISTTIAKYLLPTRREFLTTQNRHRLLRNINKNYHIGPFVKFFDIGHSRYRKPFFIIRKWNKTAKQCVSHTNTRLGHIPFLSILQIFHCEARRGQNIFNERVYRRYWVRTMRGQSSTIFPQLGPRWKNEMLDLIIYYDNFPTSPYHRTSCSWK